MRLLLLLAVPLAVVGCMRASGSPAAILHDSLSTTDREDAETAFFGAAAPIRYRAEGRACTGEVSLNVVAGEREAAWLDAKPARFDAEEGGWWRMRPVHVLRRGSAYFTGSLWKTAPARAKIEAGWTTLSEITQRVRLSVVPDGEALAGGGITFRINEPREWKLTAIGLSHDVSYAANWNWDCSYSTWKGGKPKEQGETLQREITAWRMTPTVYAEVCTMKLRNTETGEHRTVVFPTGWVICCGDFRRATT